MFVYISLTIWRSHHGQSLTEINGTNLFQDCFHLGKYVINKQTWMSESVIKWKNTLFHRITVFRIRQSVIGSTGTDHSYPPRPCAGGSLAQLPASTCPCLDTIFWQFLGSVLVVMTWTNRLRTATPPKQEIRNKPDRTMLNIEIPCSTMQTN